MIRALEKWLLAVRGNRWFDFPHEPALRRNPEWRDTAAFRTR